MKKILFFIVLMIVSPITLAQQTSMRDLIESIQELNKNITFENANNRGTIEGCIEASIKLNNRKFYLLWTNFSDEIFHDNLSSRIFFVMASFMTDIINKDIPNSIDRSILYTPPTEHSRYKYQYKLYAESDFGNEKCVSEEDNIYRTFSRFHELLSWTSIESSFLLFKKFYPRDAEKLIYYIKSDAPNFSPDFLK